MGDVQPWSKLVYLSKQVHYSCGYELLHWKSVCCKETVGNKKKMSKVPSLAHNLKLTSLKPVML